jgi:porin
MRFPAPAATLSVALLFPAQCLAEGRTLHDPPLLEFAARYTADALWNVRGGLNEGSAYVDQLELAAAFDAGRVAGIDNLTGYTSLIRTNEPTFSDRYVGDAMIVSNIDIGQTLQLLEAWVDWNFDGGGAGSLRVGLYDLNTEFDTTESRGLFLNSAYGIGQELAQSGRNGPSLYPDTALAARVAWAPNESSQFKLAVMDGVPGDPHDAGRSRWHVSESEGALWIGEVTVSAGPVAQFSIGHWRYSAQFESLRIEDPERGPSLRRDNRGTYVTAELAHRASWGNGPRWTGFMRAGEANDSINMFEHHVAAGVAVTCPWPGSTGSQLGLAASEARVGADYRELQRRAGESAERYERNVELTWRIPLGSHVVLQPDVQYVVNPGADRRIPDAWVAGLRLELTMTR